MRKNLDNIFLSNTFGESLTKLSEIMKNLASNRLFVDAIIPIGIQTILLLIKTATLPCHCLSWNDCAYIGFSFSAGGIYSQVKYMVNSKIFDEKQIWLLAFIFALLVIQICLFSAFAWNEKGKLNFLKGLAVSVILGLSIIFKVVNSEK